MKFAPRDWVLALVWLASSCGPSGSTVAESLSSGRPFGLELDARVPELAHDLTEEAVELGERIFFDPRFSADRSLSCAGCHRPEHAFADGVRFSPGVNGGAPGRNTPSIVNRILGSAQFWDGRASDLEQQVTGPLFSEHEMGLDEAALLTRLAEDDYPESFHRAFGAVPDLVLFRRAVASYELTLVSGDSPFDRHEWSRSREALTPAARLGLELFRGKARCTLCHTGTNLSDERFHDIGLGGDDIGRAAVTGLEDDRHAFKTPSLRNVGRTAPYMHDGRFATIEAVIDHYSRGGDVPGSEIVSLELAPAERAALLAFLRSLDGPVHSVSVAALRLWIEESR